MSPEEDRTRDAVDSEPKHYQRAIPDPKQTFQRERECEIESSNTHMLQHSVTEEFYILFEISNF